MQIIQRDIADLIPYPKNPRKNDRAVTKVASSIREFGFKVPVVIDKDGVIVAGHTRVKAAEQLGIKEIPCIVADDLTEEQIKAFRLADNKTAEFADWDFEILAEELADINDIDMSEFGFDIDALDDEEPETEEDETLQDAESRCRRGDLWKLGGCRLLCGDSTDSATIDRLMDGEKADMIFTDPPYGMDLDTDFSSMTSKMAEGGNQYDQGKVDEFHPEMIDIIMTIPTKEAFLWGADYYAELLPDKNAGSWFVWDKRGQGEDEEADESSDKMYGSCFELCWSKKKHKREIARVRWAGLFGLSEEPEQKRFHPTQKPIKLVAWFLNRYSKENDIVVDLYGGSGSTLIACEQLKRRCYMCEIDEHYCDIILQRWETLTGQEAVLLERDEKKDVESQDKKSLH